MNNRKRPKVSKVSDREATEKITFIFYSFFTAAHGPRNFQFGAFLGFTKLGHQVTLYFKKRY